MINGLIGSLITWFVEFHWGLSDLLSKVIGWLIAALFIVRDWGLRKPAHLHAII